MEIKPVETIVVPSASVVTLIHMEEDNNHLSATQMIEMTKRKFFVFNRDKVIQEVTNSCFRCTVRKKRSPSLATLSTETGSKRLGLYCNAYLIIRRAQEILMVQGNLTSLPMMEIIKSEKRDPKIWIDISCLQSPHNVFHNSESRRTHKLSSSRK